MNCASGSARFDCVPFHQRRNDDERWRKSYAAICLLCTDEGGVRAGYGK